MKHSNEMTQLLNRWANGERSVAEPIFAALYSDLRRLAISIFAGERIGHTLSATALLHEVYLELSALSGLRFGSRKDFFSLAACLMRRALVDHGRRKAAEKRGGTSAHVPIEEALTAAVPTPEAILALDRGLRELEQSNPALARVVELRYFVGLTVDEIATLWSLSSRTVARQWSSARRFLYLQLRSDESHAA